MLLTWRSTVRSLRTSSAAIALLVCPAATRRSTSSSRAVRLERSRVGVAQRTAGDADQRARASRLVGRLDLLPRTPRAPQGGQGRASLARGEGDRASRLGGEGRKHTRLLRVPGAIKLIRTAPRRVDLARGAERCG